MSGDVKHRCGGHADPVPRRVEQAFSFMGPPGSIRAAVAFFLVPVSFGVQALRLPTQRRRTLATPSGQKPPLTDCSAQTSPAWLQARYRPAKKVRND